MVHKVHELHAIHPIDCLFVAQVRDAWAEHTWFYSNGYIRYFAATVWMPCEHQVVADIAYGVPSGYHVHHIDHDILNNRADNLAVLSSSEHHRLHGLEMRRRATISCATCETKIEVKVSRLKYRRPVYCSSTCQGIANRVVARPSSEQLWELLCTVSNWCELGRRFGVSDKAVRKWAIRYGLDLSVCDGRRR